MKKSILLLTSALLAGFLLSSCNNVTPESTTSGMTDHDVIVSEIDRAINADGPSYTAMPIDFNPKDYGHIIPNIVSFKEGFISLFIHNARRRHHLRSFV